MKWPTRRFCPFHRYWAVKCDAVVRDRWHHLCRVSCAECSFPSSQWRPLFFYNLERNKTKIQILLYKSAILLLVANASGWTVNPKNKKKQFNFFSVFDGHSRVFFLRINACEDITFVMLWIKNTDTPKGLLIFFHEHIDVIYERNVAREKIQTCVLRKKRF